MSAEVVSDAVWALLALAAVALAVAAHLPRSRIETVLGLIRRIEAHPAGALAVLLGWMWLGWHFFAR